MKRLCALLVIVALLFSLFGCSRQQEDKLTVENFISTYSEIYTDDDYKSDPALDFYMLYDVSMDDAEIHEQEDGYLYIFTNDFYGVDSLRVVTDKKNNVKTVMTTVSVGGLINTREETIMHMSNILFAMAGEYDPTAVHELCKGLDAGETMVTTETNGVVFGCVSTEYMIITGTFLDAEIS